MGRSHLISFLIISEKQIKDRLSSAGILWLSCKGNNGIDYCLLSSNSYQDSYSTVQTDTVTFHRALETQAAPREARGAPSHGRFSASLTDPAQHTGCRPASSRPFAASVCRRGTPPPSITHACAVGPSASPRQPPTASVWFPTATLQTALRQPHAVPLSSPTATRNHRGSLHRRDGCQVPHQHILT